MYKEYFEGKLRKNNEWKCVIGSAGLVTSLHLVHGRNKPMQKGQQEKTFLVHHIF